MISITDKPLDFVSFFEALSTGIIRFGRDKEITLFNTAAEKILGLSTEQVLGKKAIDPKWKMIHEDGSDFPWDTHPSVTTLRTGLPLRNIIMGIEKPDAKTTWISINTDPVFEVDCKEITSVLCSFTDITEIKRTKEELQKSRELYHQMVDVVQDYVIIFLDKNGNIQNWNRGAQRIKGYKDHEVIGKSFKIFYTEEDKHKGVPESLLKEALFYGKASGEGWRVKKDGSHFWAQVVLTAIYDTNEEIIGFSKVTKDITERKLAEEKIRESEERIRMALENVGDNAWEHDFKKGVTYFSKSIKKIIGYENEDFEKNEKLWWTSVHPDDRWILQNNDAKYREGVIDSHSVEYRIYHKNRALKWILDRGVVIEKDEAGKPLKITGTHTNITSRKIAEQSLAQSEKKFRDLAQNVPGVIYQWVENFDGSYGFRYVSPKMKEYFGISPNEMSSFVDMIHPEDRERWRISIEEANKKESSWFFEGRLLYPDGSVKWWQGSSIMSEKTAEGNVYNGILIDISSEKQTEELLKIQQKRFEGIFNSTHQFIGLMKTDGTMLEMNRTALDFMSVKTEEVIGKPVWESFRRFMNEDTLEKLRDAVRKAAEGEFVRYDIEVFNGNGNRVWLDFSIKPVFDDEGCVIFLIPEGRDITQNIELQKRLEEEQKSKEEVIISATFEGQENERNAIARELHDNINQMLATVKLIIGNHLSGNSCKDELLEKGLQVTEDCIHEIRKLSSSLVSPVSEKIKFHDAVNELINTIRKTTSLTVSFQFDKELEKQLDQTQKTTVYRIIQEQLNNILRHSEAVSVNIRFTKKGNEASLFISDDGKGFKPNSKTSGIGFKNMKYRSQVLGGRFAVHAEPGKGCSIDLRFLLTRN